MVQKQPQKNENVTIIRNPTTVKMLACQLIEASDEYISKQISEKEYRDLVIYFSKYHGKKLYSSLNGKLNSTVINRIGKKRVELVQIMLHGFQMTMF